MDLTTPISVHVLTCFVNYYDKNHCKTIMRPQATKSIAKGTNKILSHELLYDFCPLRSVF